MFIRELPDPVSASKVDWQTATTWMGFTPSDGSLNARNKCQSTIQRQFNKGYVLEYITESLPKPNQGFEEDPAYLEEQKLHTLNAGRLTAVHRLRATSRPLQTILGDGAFEQLQTMWAKQDKPWRWSVAFPIVESYRIVELPRAKEIFAKDDYLSIYQHPSGTLRRLTDKQSAAIGNLALESIEAVNAWIAIEDQFSMAERSPIEPRILRAIKHDLNDKALEGQPEKRRASLRRRAAWIAQSFAFMRRDAGQLKCDQCNFDPSSRSDLAGIKPRSLLDVHHKNPLKEGLRYTTVADFSLLCPTCHRIEHALLVRDSAT